jgi:hypothetical protein
MLHVTTHFFLMFLPLLVGFVIYTPFFFFVGVLPCCDNSDDILRCNPKKYAATEGYRLQIGGSEFFDLNKPNNIKGDYCFLPSHPPFLLSLYLFVTAVCKWGQQHR